MRLDTKAFAIASAGAGMLLYVIGALMDAAATWGGAAVVSYIFRVNVTQLDQPLSLVAVIAGLVACGFMGGVLGLVVARGYNFLVSPAPAAVTKPAPT